MSRSGVAIPDNGCDLQRLTSHSAASVRSAACNATAGVDLCEYHDYSTVAMPGDQWNGLSTRISQCASLGKPLFVGESGVKATDAGGTLTDRANLFGSKVTTQFNAGVVGELLWDWRDSAHGGSSTSGYEIGPGDPALSALAAG